MRVGRRELRLQEPTTTSSLMSKRIKNQPRTTKRITSSIVLVVKP
jgi:hypothetical protein